MPMYAIECEEYRPPQTYWLEEAPSFRSNGGVIVFDDIADARAYCGTVKQHWRGPICAMSVKQYTGSGPTVKKRRTMGGFV